MFNHNWILVFYLMFAQLTSGVVFFILERALLETPETWHRKFHTNLTSHHTYGSLDLAHYNTKIVRRCVIFIGNVSISFWLPFLWQLLCKTWNGRYNWICCGNHFLYVVWKHLPGLRQGPSFFRTREELFARPNIIPDFCEFHSMLCTNLPSLHINLLRQVCEFYYNALRGLLMVELHGEIPCAMIYI